MLANAVVTPTLPAVDLKRARKFYEEKLGLKVIMEDPSPGIMLQAGKGTMLYIYQRGRTRANHTVAAFTVDDIGAELDELKRKGVKFEEYEVPRGCTKEKGNIVVSGNTKSAWFKDTEGNILALVQPYLLSTPEITQMIASG